MRINSITDDISYIEMTMDPLSADVGIIRAGNETWLFDVGADERVADYLEGEYNVVVSHFHQDHAGNYGRVNIKESYVSKLTMKHVHDGNLIEEDMYVGDMHIFLIPSSHSKGCLGLELGDFAFVGDAIYGKGKDGFWEYNAQLLKSEIDVLKGLNAKWLLVSHYPGMKRDRMEVIEELHEIYSKREKNSPVILVEMSR